MAEGGRADLALERADAATLLIHLRGSWQIEDGVPSIDPVAEELAREPPPRRLAFDSSGIGEWDSSLLLFVEEVRRLAGERHVEIDRSGLHPGLQRLVHLAETASEQRVPPRSERAKWLVARVGQISVYAWEGVLELLAFIGDLSVAFARALVGRARYQRSDLFVLIQDCGVQALPIVTLISFLVGLILAFVGAVQLQQFGASIYVANLVGLAMLREMGAMMTAIIMAGRTGSGYAAQLGSMKVSQEIDALETLGLSPMEFLVLPRIVALWLMMPLLCIYSDFVGILGGAVVSAGMLDVPMAAYVNQTKSAVGLVGFALGVAKSAVFGVLIAVAGCLRGLQSGGSSSAVGDAATKAVVTAIVWIIAVDGLFAVLTNALGI
jgi:phospholipid/cholesterol/gamma-HCH transport system permease protein